jgi:hypothetical protein
MQLLYTAVYHKRVEVVLHLVAYLILLMVLLLGKKLCILDSALCVVISNVHATIHAYEASSCAFIDTT